MIVRKAIITAAARTQRQLPLQVVADRDGTSRSVLEMLIREALSAGIEEVAVVIAPGDKPAYAAAAGSSVGSVTFVEQTHPHGYGDAILAAEAFAAGESVLHFVGDHLFLSSGPESCARQLAELARRESCSVSAVQSTREHALPFYGTIGGRRVPNTPHTYEVENVIEKPTPTQAEQTLLVPGLRAGHYLCFVGMHVLTPGALKILKSLHAKKPTLSDALALLPRSERYLALESSDTRFNVGVKHGLLMAQLALALSGPDRDDILTQLVELLASKPNT
jgi:UTP--glucose-1-phosphate uridylyltransferase